MTPQPFQAGTENQHGYLTRLTVAMGKADLVETCAEILRVDVDALREQGSLSVADARLCISALQASADSSARHAPATTPPSSDRRYTTAKQLHDYATGAVPAPGELDRYATWVLRRLATLDAVLAAIPQEALIGPTSTSPGQRRNVNVGGPIMMTHLLLYYSTWDRLAEAMGVTVSTAKSWGDRLPEARVFEAEVKTAGFVRVPDTLRGGA